MKFSFIAVVVLITRKAIVHFSTVTVLSDKELLAIHEVSNFSGKCKWDVSCNLVQFGEFLHLCLKQHHLFSLNKRTYSYTSSLHAQPLSKLDNLVFMLELTLNCLATGGYTCPKYMCLRKCFISCIDLMVNFACAIKVVDCDFACTHSSHWFLLVLTPLGYALSLWVQLHYAMHHEKYWKECNRCTLEEIERLPL